ncbi:MAG: MFS transporter [Bacteroidales bacterium]|nr:MFS transporter [Bacteroidales bacterium]
MAFKKDIQYYKFCLYGFLKNQRFFEPFFILYLLDKGFGFLEIGTIYTIREITRNIFEVPAGFGADALGRKKTMMASFGLYIISFLVYWQANTYVVLIVATLFFALADAFRTGTHKAMIFDYLQRMGWSDQKVHYYGHTRSWSQLGSAVSSLIAASIIFISGTYELVFLFSGIPYFLGFFLILSYPGYLDGKNQQFGISGIRTRFKKVWKEFALSLRQPEILKAVANVSSFSGYYQAVKDYLQPIIVSLTITLPFLTSYREEQRSAIFVGVIYFLIYLLTSAASRNAGKFADRFRHLSTPLNLTLVLGILVGAVSGLLYHFEFILVSVILFIMVYLLENLRMPVGVSYIGENLNEDILATALSVESQGKTIFSAALAFLLGLFAEKFGVGTGLVIVSGILLVPVPFILLRYR